MKLLKLTPLLLLILLVIGCIEEKGPVEKAGEKIDQVADEAEDVIDEAS